MLPIEYIHIGKLTFEFLVVLQEQKQNPGLLCHSSDCVNDRSLLKFLCLLKGKVRFDFYILATCTLVTKPRMYINDQLFWCYSPWGICKLSIEWFYLCVIHEKGYWMIPWVRWLLEQSLPTSSLLAPCTHLSLLNIHTPLVRQSKKQIFPLFTFHGS